MHVGFLKSADTLISEQHSGVFDESAYIRIWDADVLKETRSFSLSAPPARFNGSSSSQLVSPDGTMLAIVRNSSVKLWQIATGQPVADLRGHAGMINAAAFSPDGKILATACYDTTVLLWDIELAQLYYLWREMPDDTAEVEFSTRFMKVQPAKAMAFLRDHLHWAAQIEDQARRLIRDLNDPQFKKRDQATLKLQHLGPAVIPILRQTLQENVAAESRARIQLILERWPDRVESATQFDPRRVQVALGILERIGSAEARRIIEDLARGPAESIVTRDAKAAHERMKKVQK
jgi:hypothetical protein